MLPLNQTVPLAAYSFEYPSTCSILIWVWILLSFESSGKSDSTAFSVTETNPSSMRKTGKKPKTIDMIEKYFRKQITLHYFSHQFWLVFISISSRLVETQPVPSLRDAAEQSFLTTLRYSHARSKAAALGLFLWMWDQAHFSLGLSYQAEELVAGKSCLHLK